MEFSYACLDRTGVKEEGWWGEGIQPLKGKCSSESLSNT